MIGIIASQYYNADVDNAPSAPNNIVTSNITDTSADIDWADSIDDNGISGYNFYLDGVKNNVSLILVSEYDLTGLTAGTEYEFTIEAVDSIGQTAMSVATQFTTTGTAPAGVVTDVTYSSVYGSGQTFGYKQYVPGGYTGGTAFPLVIWLHGLGERSPGNGAPQLGRLDAYGPFWEILENSKEYNFLMIAPQQPEDVDGLYTSRSSWDEEVIEESLNHFKNAGYNIDLNTVYVTGQSMGGGGVFTYLRYYGSTIAAGLAICPTNTQTSNTCLTGIKETPLWLIHNRQDNVVNISSTQNYINNMLACVPAPTLNPKATIYEGGVAHNGWAAVYGEVSPGTLSDDANITIPNGYNEPYPETGTGLIWWEWLQQYSL